MAAVAKGPREYQAFRIKAGESNRLAIIFDGPGESTDFIACVEIFDEGGATPPNTHQGADEFFFVLRGEGLAICDGARVELRPGASLLVKAGAEHVIENTGAGRLYLLTIMVPDEAFSALIRNGVPAELDAEDLAVLEAV